MASPSDNRLDAGKADAASPNAQNTALSQSLTAASQMVAAPVVGYESLPENIDEHVEAGDNDDNDSAYGSSVGSDTTSVNSAYYRGYMENGRKYQSFKEDGYLIPADEQQMECLAAGHLVFKIVDCQQENPLFRSPIEKEGTTILDVGTGDGSWPIDVADTFPGITVHGVDIYPPPHTNVPPNCVLEIDDVTKAPWTWSQNFDLIHLRLILGSLSADEWKGFYKEAYRNLKPGGWIEHYEIEPGVFCDDETLPPDSSLAGLGDLYEQCAVKYGKSIHLHPTMRADIEAAGFINVHEKNIKVPIGDWPKHPVYRDAGRVGLQTFKAGMEGWTMFLLTKFGPPEPWSPERFQAWLAGLRKELDQRWHIYQKTKRVWAQKPYDAVKEERQVEVESLEEPTGNGSDGEEKTNAKKQKVSPPSPPS